MGGTVARVLVDTNVWLDKYLPLREGHDAACQALADAVAHDVELAFATSSAKDVFYLVASCLKREARAQGEALSSGDAAAIRALAWAVVDNMCECATAIGADMPDVWLARKYRSVHADFEDDLVIVAAQRARADLIVTRDEQLIRHSPVACMTPGDLSRLLNA